MTNILRDLRLAWRVLRNSPGFAAVAVVTLGLGIAASTVVFSWIDTVLLWPITGVWNAHELVALEGIAPEGGRLAQCTHPDFRAFQKGLTVASGVVASHISFFTIGSSDHPGRALGEVISANYFTVLGVKPFLGRLFLPEEDQDAPGAYPSRSLVTGCGQPNSALIQASWGARCASTATRSPSSASRRLISGARSVGRHSTSGSRSA